MSRKPPLQEALRTPFRLVVVGCLVLSMAAGAALGLPGGVKSPWALDADGNGLHDALDDDLASGRTGALELFVHYADRPSGDDAQGLVGRGAFDAYVFHNWNVIQVTADYSVLGGLLRAPGVTGLERFDAPVLDLDVSAQAVRVRPATGVPVVDGIDHSLAVQSAAGGPTGDGIVIAIIDTGVDNTHESLDDLDDNPATNDPKLVQKPDPLTGLPIYAGVSVETKTVIDCIDPDDDHGHATSVAGIALGTGGPLATMRGMAPGARLVDIDAVLGLHLSHPFPADNIALGVAEGLDWVLDYNAGLSCYGDPGADAIDVVSMSISSSPGAGSDPDTALNRMIDDVVRSGVAFVQSAGNKGPASGTIGAGAEGAIIVANAIIRDTVIRSDDILKGSSSRGPRLPDSDADTLDELRPDIAAPGHNTRTANAGTGDGYIDFTGTSAAAPHIAGIVALLLDLDPDLRPIDAGSYEAMGDAGSVPVRDLLQQSAQIKTATEETPPQSSATGKFGHAWNNAWGYGLVDAFAAACLADPSLAGCA